MSIYKIQSDSFDQMENRAFVDDHNFCVPGRGAN